MQVTGIFGSSMEVYICVDGESPGSSPSAGGPQENGSNHGVEAAPGVFHCGSAFATVGTGSRTAFAYCCPRHQRAWPAAARALHQDICLYTRFGDGDAQVVSAAGPWPPVAVPVPFRLEPSTEEERLRCKVWAADILTSVASSSAGSRLNLPCRERRVQHSGVQIGC